MRIKLWLIPMMWLLATCVEPFELKSDRYDQAVVVEGGIHSDAGPYEVLLSTAASIDRVSKHPLGNCLVEIEDENGERFELKEAQPGQYLSDSEALQGQVGMAYRLHISTPNHGDYQSSWERIPAPMGIEQVTAEYAEKTEPDYPLNVYGFQFYIDSETPESGNHYYLWQLSSTYRYNADFKIEFYYAGGVFPFPKRDSLYTCYRTQNIPEIYTFSTAVQSKPSIQHFALNFEDTRSRALMDRYSLLVEQHVIGERAHRYWTDLKQINENDGGVYASQPFQVTGNISNVTDSTVAAMGYFMASGKTEHRIFVEWNHGHQAYPECVLTDQHYMDYGYLRFSRSYQWPILITTNTAGARAVVPRGCLDCTVSGGVLEKPEFWID